MDTKELQIISLNGFKKIIKEIYKNSNKTFKENYQNVAVVIYGNIKNSIQVMLTNAIPDISLEIMCLTKECFGSGGINSTKEVNNALKAIKVGLTSDFSSMNAERFLKLFRDSVVHRSKEKNHIKTKDFEDMSIDLVKNKRGETETVDINKFNMIKYMIEYDNARKLDKKFAKLEIDKDLTSNVNLMLKSKKQYSSFNNFIEVFDEKGQKIEMDNYQENAYLRFLLKYRKYASRFKDFDYFKMRFFPHKDNKINNYELKNRLIFGMTSMMFNTEIKINDIVKSFQDYNDVCGMFFWLDEETVLSTIYSSMCFSMFSSRTNEELFDLLTECGCDIDEDIVRHLRNSFVHGRYFYNYKNGFEIYDGTTELNHYTTFTFDQIDKLFIAYSQANIELIKSARAECRLKKILKDNQENIF